MRKPSICSSEGQAYYWMHRKKNWKHVDENSRKTSPVYDFSSLYSYSEWIPIPVEKTINKLQCDFDMLISISVVYKIGLCSLRILYIFVTMQTRNYIIQPNWEKNIATRISVSTNIVVYNVSMYLKIDFKAPRLLFNASLIIN